MWGSHTDDISFTLVKMREHPAYNGNCVLSAWCVQDSLHPQPADVEKPEQQWRAGSLYGASLLQALLSDAHSQSLQAWATAAPAVLDAIAEAQAACSSSEGEQVQPSSLLEPESSHWLPRNHAGVPVSVQSTICVLFHGCTIRRNPHHCR